MLNIKVLKQGRLCYLNGGFLGADDILKAIQYFRDFQTSFKCETSRSATLAFQKSRQTYNVCYNNCYQAGLPGPF